VIAMRHSVIIPMLNGAAYVRDAIASALPQLADDDEVLVIDNGSTDGSRELVGQIADRRVRLMTEPKRGPAAARNLGIRSASGATISFLDHDDMWPEGRHDGLMRALAAEPGADAAYGRTRMLFGTRRVEYLAHQEGQHAPMLGLHPYLFRRELIARAGFMNEEMPFGEDGDYLLRLRAAGMRCAVYDGLGAIYRLHDANMTRDLGASAQGRIGTIARHLARKRQTDRERGGS
jgi:glycosyltransferase involved in cell wall biosynthesis